MSSSVAGSSSRASLDGRTPRPRRPRSRSPAMVASRPYERYEASPPASPPPSPPPTTRPPPSAQPQLHQPKRKHPALTHETWINRDEAVARCFADDLQTIQLERQGDIDRFRLNTFPCIAVELVGVLMYTEQGAQKRTYFVDDGSSVMAEVTDKGAALQPKEADLSVPRPPRFKNGVTVRVRASLGWEWGKLALYVRRGLDIAEVSAEEETRHIKAVNRLHREVYPDFDRTAYLASDLLPPPRPRLKPAPALRLPTTIAPTVPIESSISSLAKPITQTGRSASFHPAGSPNSASFSFADMSMLSSVAGSQYEAPSGSSSLPDPNTVSSSVANEDGLKTYILDYMQNTIECEWGRDIDPKESDQHPVQRWLKEEMELDASRAPASSPSPSWDSSDDEEDNEPPPPPSAQPHPSSSRYSSPPRMSASPPDDSSPPFSLPHLLKVRTLDTYAKKVLQGAILDRIKPPKGSSKARARASGTWDRDLEVGLRRGEGKERVDWTSRLKGKETVWREWREAKRSALVLGALKGLMREGEIFVVSDESARQRASGPSTPTPKRMQTSTRSTASTTSTGRDLYLPTCLPTVGPLVLHLLRVEVARVQSTHAGRKIPGIRAAPVWVSTATLLRRLQASHERWNWISAPVLEGLLDRMDDGDWVEESKGRGWKLVGS